MKAVIVCIALAGCFPHQPKLRGAALATEAAAIVGGLVMTTTIQGQRSCNADELLCHTTHSPLELVGPALTLVGLIAGGVTLASTSDEPPPALPRAVASREPVRDVRTAGGDPAISVGEAWEMAHDYRLRHAIVLDDHHLYGAAFDAIARQWVFVLQPDAVTIAVHESGRIVVSR